MRGRPLEAGGMVAVGGGAPGDSLNSSRTSVQRGVGVALEVPEESIGGWLDVRYD